MARLDVLVRPSPLTTRHSILIDFIGVLDGRRFRAEIYFVSMRAFATQWGTRSPIIVRTQAMGGRCFFAGFGSYSFQVGRRAAVCDADRWRAGVFRLRKLITRMRHAAFELQDLFGPSAADARQCG